MAKYQVDAEKLLESIGGKENIAAVSHCATRMRFVLNDQQKADEKKQSKIFPVSKECLLTQDSFK